MERIDYQKKEKKQERKIERKCKEGKFIKKKNKKNTKKEQKKFVNFCCLIDADLTMMAVKELDRFP